MVGRRDNATPPPPEREDSLRQSWKTMFLYSLLVKWMENGPLSQSICILFFLVGGIFKPRGQFGELIFL